MHGIGRIISVPGPAPERVVREVEAKSILNASKIYDFCLNPYTGCQVGCRYCYAALFMRRYSGHTEPWGRFVDVKVNAPELLEKQVAKAKRKGTIWIASVCDPYQPLEKKYALTRRMLKTLEGKGFPVVIQTKSALLLRDLDVIGRLEDVEVGFSVATEDEETARLFEPNAAPVRERIEILKTFKSAGVRTYAFAGPLLPGNPEKLAALLGPVVDHVFIDRMNYLPAVREMYARHGLLEFLSDAFFRKQGAVLARELRARGVQVQTVFK